MSSAERIPAERRGKAQRRGAEETRRKGAEAQSLKPAEFRAEVRKRKHKPELARSVLLYRERIPNACPW